MLNQVLNVSSGVGFSNTTAPMPHKRGATAMDVDGEEVRLYRRITHMISFKLMQVQGAVTVVHGLRVCVALSHSPRTGSEQGRQPTCRRWYGSLARLT